MQQRFKTSETVLELSAAGKKSDAIKTAHYKFRSISSLNGPWGMTIGSNWSGPDPNMIILSTNLSYILGENPGLVVMRGD